MKLLPVLFLSILFSTVANASYLESCQLKVKVVNRTTLGKVDGKHHDHPLSPIVVAEVTEALNQGSHREEACESHVGQLKILELDRKVYMEVVEGSELVLNYFFVSGFTPRGIRSSTKWTLIK